MEFDYSKLRGKIKEKVGTQDNLANILGIGRVTLSQRLTGKSEFTQSEIIKICESLEIGPNEIHEYFFTPRV